MSEIDPVLAAIAAAAVFCCVLALVMMRRALRPMPPSPSVVFEEAVTELKLEPWSPTRGFYYFRAVDLPGAYLKLPGITPQHTVKQFGEDVDDARLRLHRLMIEKALKARMSIDLAVIVAEPCNFRPLTRRKGQVDAR